jgi:hypothetical protein
VIVEAVAAVALARVQVVADEWSLVLSRSRLRAGPALVELVNMGEDDHDLRLRRLASRARARTTRIATTLPGERGEAETRLAPGTYRLWCSLPGHAARGMRARLVVTSR